MNDTPIYSLPAYLCENAAHYALIRSLTGVEPNLPLDDLFEPLALPFDVIDPVMTEIWERHNRGVNAAFAAGLACGLLPERVLLEQPRTTQDVWGAVTIVGLDGEA